MERTAKEKNFISTIFVALFIATDAINLIVTRIFPARTNFMSVFYALTGAGILAGYILNGREQRFKMRLEHFIAVVLVALYYLTTYLVIGGSSLSLSFFLVFVFLPLLIPILADIDVKLLLRVIFIVPAFGVFRASQILLLTTQKSMTMGDCYALLIPVIAALTYLMVFYREDTKKAKIWLLPCIAVNCMYFFRIVLYGSRGPILSVILCFVFLMLFRRRRFEGNAKRTWQLILFTLLVAIFVLYFWEILELLSSIASRAGLNIRAIEKAYILKQSSSIWNGRDNIFAVTISGITEKPIFGHGMSTFQNNTGIIYPHNFILQILYDGGIVLFFTLIIPLIIGVLKMVRVGDTNEFALFTTLFFASVPGALFSGDCWKNGCLWLLIGLIIAGKLPDRKRQFEKNNANWNTDVSQIA